VTTTNASPTSNGRGSDAWFWSWTHFSVDRRSLGYCRVTFDHPPVNTVTATTVAELAELVGLIEGDPDLNVVVFDSANPDFYLADHDTEHDPGAWLDLLVRLSRAPVVSIASIRGRAHGAGSEFVLACDLRFASGENASLGQFNVRSRSRALEILLVADDQLDGEVEAIATQIALRSGPDQR
jgi:1,4-dihydroxy-2-naphthoyl-CoA synthase